RAACETRRKRGQNILDVVSSAQTHFIAGHQDALAVFGARYEFAFAQKQPVVQFARNTEPHHVRAQTIRPRGNDFIVSVKDPVIATVRPRRKREASSTSPITSAPRRSA